MGRGTNWIKQRQEVSLEAGRNQFWQRAALLNCVSSNLEVYLEVEERRMVSWAGVCFGNEAARAGAAGKWEGFFLLICRAFLVTAFTKARCCVKGTGWSLDQLGGVWMNLQGCSSSHSSVLQPWKCCCSTWCKQLKATPFCWGFWLEGLLSWEFSFPSRSTGFSKAVQKKTCSRLLAEDEMMSMVRWNCQQCVYLLRCDWQNF